MGRVGASGFMGGSFKMSDDNPQGLIVWHAVVLYMKLLRVLSYTEKYFIIYLRSFEPEFYNLFSF